MQVSHTARAVSASFDDPNLVSAAGLVPLMKLAEKAGLRKLSDRWLSVPTDKGANAGLKVASLVGGMVVGADSIDDMAVLRHGGMRKVFTACYAPSTLGSFLRQFAFGHVRQLDAVASRFLGNLTEEAPLLPGDDAGGYVLLDVDDTIIEVHGYQKQGSGYGYSGVRGINALLATVKTSVSAPVIIAQRLRRGACGSPRGAARLIRDALAAIKRLHGLNNARVLFRADAAYYGLDSVNAAIKAGAAVSVTARMDPAIKRAITTIPEDAWEAIEYTDAIYDEASRTWISNAEVAEVPFTAFSSRKKSEHIVGRLVVRRIPELNKKDLDHPTLFDTHRFHAFFTTSDLATVTADKTHRGHHRAGQRGPEKQRFGAPAIGSVHRKRRLARPGRHRIQPHPRRSNHRRRWHGQSNNGHHPPETGQRPSEDRVFRKANHASPARPMAMGKRLGGPVRSDLRATTTSAHLLSRSTPTHHQDNEWNQRAERSDDQSRPRIRCRLESGRAQRPQPIGGSRLRKQS